MPQKERSESAVKSPGEEGSEKKERKKQVTAPNCPLNCFYNIPLMPYQPVIVGECDCVFLHCGFWALWGKMGKSVKCA